ncbi:hypothetical protein D9758_006704 [Tetrapyrgos nigripes]|uniref:AB hydrolase-1 domain-containing protein n=1 Tax=Tetrapyrgos nigripes TaxID=182062 RepID=A0A8H5GIW6_9AGAR|nr:hypothetical protein D9758_006704 [Tetrapyrgos nigripes]
MSNLNDLIEQEYLHVPTFTLECGAELRDVPVAYKTWGTLNETRDNVMVICHAFTGSADVPDWWGPLMGPGKAFDPRRWFIFCGNVLGSPYGTASPITVNPDTGVKYGPDFPPTSIRDDVRLHKHVLDHLGVSSIGVVIGGSMGGMAVLEWPLCSPPGYVKHIVPLATSAKHSAWCISWGEAQRQSIYADPGYQGGYYESQPATGLAAARMAALLTYRSRDSFEKRFGRKAQIKKEDTNGMGTGTGAGTGRKGIPTPPGSPKILAKDDARFAHNDGHRNSQSSRVTSPEPPTTAAAEFSSQPSIFSAQSYLRYQGDKFTARFDANCYIHITRKLDTHDISRDRHQIDADGNEEPETSALPRVLSTLPPRALVISISTDGLFTPTEQREIASHIPQSELVTVQSPDGHDGFLLEFEQINGHVMRFLKREFPELYEGDGAGGALEGADAGDFEIKKTSVFGEAEADVAHW